MTRHVKCTDLQRQSHISSHISYGSLYCFNYSYSGQPVKGNLLSGQAILQKYFPHYNTQVEVGRMAMAGCRLLQKALIGVCYLRWTPIQHRNIAVKIAVNKAGRHSTLLLKMKISSAITEEKQNHKELCFVMQDNRLIPLPFFFFFYGICKTYTISLWLFIYRYNFQGCFYFNHLSKLKIIKKHFL